MAIGGLLSAFGDVLGGVFGGGKQKQSESSNYTASGSRSPILSQDWTNAFNAAQGNLNGSGFTSGQQGAYNWLGQSMGPNSAVGMGVSNANGLLGQNMGSLDNLQSGYNWLAAQPAQQLGAAPTSEYAGDVNARTGASFMDQYQNPFNSQVIDATVGDYNTNVDRTLTGLRQSRDAAGAFGDRAAIADGTFLGDANRGLLSTVANLRANNFQNSALLGMQDANRFLSADQGNQGTRQQNNQFNSGLLNNREMANIGYKQDQTNNIFRSAEGVANTLAQKTGLGQQVLANIVTANGIDTDAAKSMFDMGQISQSQLSSILEAAQAANGETRDETKVGTGTSTSQNGVLNWGGVSSGLGKIFDELKR